MSQRMDPNYGRLTVETQDDGHTLRIILCGSADDTTATDLETALADIQPNGAYLVQFDVSELDFVDVAALRQLVLFAQQLRATGRAVETHGAHPMLEQLTHLVGVHEDLGLA